MYGKKTQRFSGSEAVTYNQKQETSLIPSEFVWTPGIFSIKSFHTYYAKVEVGFKKKNEMSVHLYPQSYRNVFLGT